MTKVITGFILGLVLALPISALAFGHDLTDYEYRVIELLEQIERHGEDLTSDVETILNRM